jgi:RNA polymerase sigma-70 factor (ECF subfamily)
VVDDVNRQTEVELVEAALTGDVDSFGELYRRHYTAVVGAAYCVVGDRHLAEDAAQEAFAVACRHLPRLRRADKFACWIRSIGKRVAGRMARSRRESELPPETAAPSTAHAGHDGSDLVHQAVLHLPSAAREVIVLHYFTGLTHKQIAAMLDVSPEAVHGRLVRARRKLADALRRNGVGSVEP